MSGSPDDTVKLMTVEATSSGVVTLKLGDALQEVSSDEAREIASAIHEAANVVSYTDEVRAAWYRRFMQYLMLEISTHPELLEEGKPLQVGIVHCWIRDQTQSNAYHVATGWTNDAGWIVTRVIEHRDVIRDVFEATNLIQYYDQALIDSEVFYFEVATGSTA